MNMTTLGALLGWSLIVIVRLFILGCLEIKDGQEARDRESIISGAGAIGFALFITAVDLFAVWLASK